MRRARTLGVAGIVALLAFAAGAQADHDRAHPFAGNWTIDPAGDPGQLSLGLVSDAAGRAAIASLGSTLACAEPSDYYTGRLATPTDRGPLAGCTSTGDGADRLDGVYLSEALAPAGPPAELDILVEHLAGGTQATAFLAAPRDPGTVRVAPLVFDTHVAADGARVEPLVTLRLRLTGRRVATGASVSITGTFRGRAVAGRRTYRLPPLGGATATHRHGTAAAQRARLEPVSVDVRSGSAYLRVTGSGPLVGGPAIAGPRGTCRRIAFSYTVRPKADRAVLRWACRPAGADRSRPVHLDVLRLPRDTIASRYTLTRRPCSRSAALERGTAEVAATC